MVLVFCGEESGRMGFPVTARVEVVGGVVTVIEAVAVRLRRRISLVPLYMGEKGKKGTHRNINKGN